MAEKILAVKKQLSSNELAVLIGLAALIFGSWLRLNPAAMAGFPMNDGGMFYTMIEDLRQNHYSLPTYTTYNNLNIPYTYPPLPFYLAGLLTDIFHIPLLQVLLWLPAVVNIATIPAFYLLSSAILEIRLKAALATLIYALAPVSIDWFLMGGGLTRGMGQLFLILTCWSAYELFHQPAKKILALTILSGALVVVSHPESALLAVVSAAIIWLFSARSKQTVIHGLLVCAGITMLVSPWLIYLLGMHGIEPFFKAAQTNGSQLLLWTKIFTFDFTLEALPGFIAVLGLIGLFVKISQKEYLLPMWVVIPFLINPRSSARAAILSLAMLAAICLLDVILPAIRSFEARFTGTRQADSVQMSTTGYLLLGYLLLHLLVDGYSLGVNMAANRLNMADQQAMAWVQKNTLSDSRFVIVTGELQLLRDPVQEWFPALTGRSSQTTLQGREWLWGNKFIQSIITFGGLQNCITQNTTCIELETQALSMPFEYLYIKKQTIIQCPAEETCRYNSEALVEDLKKSAQYKLVYESSGAAIFGKGQNENQK